LMAKPWSSTSVRNEVEIAELTAIRVAPKLGSIRRVEPATSRIALPHLHVRDLEQLHGAPDAF
jgi:hypothetical protein